MRKMMLAAALTLGATLAAPASASEIVFLSGDSTSGAFGRAQIGAGSFTDTLLVTISRAGTLASSLTSSTFRIGSSTDLDFTNVQLLGPGGPYSFSLRRNDGLDARTDTADLATILRAGSYTLSISGISRGRGSYGGNVNFDVAAVPEPATWGMMILGFGLIGGVMRRRYKTTGTRVAFA